MLYFNSFPKIITTDYNNNLMLMTNIMNRAEIIPSLLKNPLLFYSYDIKESDRPDIIADKYYNDSNRYWMVLLANNIIDPQGGWPLSGQQFDQYILSKYSADAGSDILAVVTSYTQGTVHHYEKIITTSDTSNLQQQSLTIQIDEDTYNNTIEKTTQKTFSNGVVVTETISKKAVSIYEYESNLKIGGHDLYAELAPKAGKFIIFKIICQNIIH